MLMQSSMDRCSAPKRVRRESVDPTGVKTRRQVAEAFYRAQSPSSAAENIVLMTVHLATALTGDLPVFVTNILPSTDKFRASLVFPTPVACTDADQNPDTSNVDTARWLVAAHSFESPLAGQLDAYRPSSLLLGFPESDLDPVAAFASPTASTPLLADAAVTADAPVEADSFSLSHSLLHRRICDELLTGCIVDDENPSPWLEELAMSTSRHELTLEVMDATVGLTFDGAMGGPMDASWAVTAGDFRAAPGSC
jgi:hypothetical protein